MTQFKFDINGAKYDVDIKSVEGNSAAVEVNGNLYQVNIEGEEVAPAPVRPVEKPIAPVTPVKPAAAQQTANDAQSAQGCKSIKAPLPGSVLKVNVEVGTAFKEGDVLMVMESMKMENNIAAEVSGTITNIIATAGSAVLQDDILFEYN